MLVAFSVDCLWISWRSNHLKSAQLNLRTIEDSERRVRGCLKDARATDTRDAIECQRSVRCVCVQQTLISIYKLPHTHTHAHKERNRQTARDAVRSLHSRRCLSSKEGGKLCSLSLPSSPSPSPCCCSADKQQRGSASSCQIFRAKLTRQRAQME